MVWSRTGPTASFHSSGYNRKYTSTATFLEQIINIVMYIYNRSTETEEPGRQNSKQLTTSTLEKDAKTGFSLMLFFL